MLAGDAVSLRPVEVGDAKLLAEWFGDPAFVGQFFDVHPQSEAEWEKELGGEPTLPDWHQYIITKRDTGEPVGQAGYLNSFAFPSYRMREIFYSVHPRARRQGIARQAASLLINHLFNVTPIERIEARLVVGNEPSARVLEAAGMHREGTCRRLFFLHGKYVDLDLYSIIREEWRDEPSYRADRQPF
jgi:ribosomal-protein-alanine N-acetyltransferase